MKKGIHPKYYTEAKVICACGNTWTTGSTKEEIRTDMCSKCHPFFTGEQRIVDTAGQVDRFQRRLDKVESQAPKARRRRVERQRQQDSIFEFAAEDIAAAAASLSTEAQPVEQETAVAETASASGGRQASGSRRREPRSTRRSSQPAGAAGSESKDEPSK